MDRPTLSRLAGLLAEHGVQRLVIVREGRSFPLAARRTDLPAELERLSAQGGTLEAPQLGLSIAFGPGGSGVSWACRDPDLTLRVARLLAPT